jgi:hypothetical protein
MATNKAKRSIHLAQATRRCSNPQPATELMPVKARIYQAVTELNVGFEKVVRDLRDLQRVEFFCSERVAELHNAVCRIRAQINQEFLKVMNEREMANDGHFESIGAEKGTAG